MARKVKEQRIWDSVEEAKQNERGGKDKDGNKVQWQLWTVVSPDGKRWHIWSGSQGVALSQAVTDLGWQCYPEGGRQKGKPDLKAALAGLSEEERKELLKDYIPQEPTKHGKRK